MDANIVAELERKLAQLDAQYLAAHMRVIAAVGDHAQFVEAQAAFDAIGTRIVSTRAALAEARREAAIQAARETEQDDCICYGLDNVYCPACAKLNAGQEIPY